MENYGFYVSLDALVEGLSVGEEQRVEILKALYRGIDLLIPDEPTAVLTPSEADQLFQNLRCSRADGKTVVFISHSLDEVLKIADRITVLRRGKVVGETAPAQTSKEELAEMMVGRPVLFRLEKPDAEFRGARPAVEGLAVDGRVRGVDLQVRGRDPRGWGLRATGSASLAEALIGLWRPTAGRVLLDGQDVAALQVTERRARGTPSSPRTGMTEA